MGIMKNKLSCGGDFRSQKTTGRWNSVWFSHFMGSGYKNSWIHVPWIKSLKIVKYVKWMILDSCSIENSIVYNKSLKIDGEFLLSQQRSELTFFLGLIPMARPSDLPVCEVHQSVSRRKMISGPPFATSNRWNHRSENHRWFYHETTPTTPRIYIYI